MPDACEELAIDNDWSLTRTNACHIGVMNSEMGELRDSQIEMNLKLDIMIGIFVAIGIALIALVVKKMWE